MENNFVEKSNLPFVLLVLEEAFGLFFVMLFPFLAGDFVVGSIVILVNSGVFLLTVKKSKTVDR